jgi:transcription antitermination factor NusG
MEQSVQWYVLIAFKKEVQAALDLEAAHHPSLEHFIPMYYRVTGTDARRVRKKCPLMPNYVFLRGTLADVYHYKQSHPYLHFKMDDAADAQRYLTVPDAQMHTFMRVARMFEEDIRYYRPEEVQLEKGDRVRIIGGPLDGVEGILLCSQGKMGGRVVVELDGLMSVSTWEIAPEYLQILSFSSEGRRQYNQFNAFTARAYQAMTDCRTTGKVAEHDAIALQLFIKRLEHLQADTTNSDITLHTLLLMAHTVLKQESGAIHEQQRCDALLQRVVSSSQRVQALIRMWVSTLSPNYHDMIQQEVATWTDVKDRKRTTLLAELQQMEQLIKQPRH